MFQIDEKELKMRYNIDAHDYNVRLKAARKFLSSGNRVKVPSFPSSLPPSGRERRRYGDNSTTAIRARLVPWRVF